MKYKLLTIVMMLLAVTACKTTEKNYREAYDLVMQKRDNDRRTSADVDSMVTGEFFTSGRPVMIKVGSDTLSTRVDLVRISDFDGNRTEPLERFNVVVGSFKQVFNARSLMQKLRDLGYDSFVINNNEPSYFVIAASSGMAVDALGQLRSVAADNRLTLRNPYPWVLQPAQLQR